MELKRCFKQEKIPIEKPETNIKEILLEKYQGQNTQMNQDNYRLRCNKEIEDDKDIYSDMRKQ